MSWKRIMILLFVTFLVASPLFGQEKDMKSLIAQLNNVTSGTEAARKLVDLGPEADKELAWQRAVAGGDLLIRLKLVEDARAIKKRIPFSDLVKKHMPTNWLPVETHRTDITFYAVC